MNFKASHREVFPERIRTFCRRKQNTVFYSVHGREYLVCCICRGILMHERCRNGEYIIGRQVIPTTKAFTLDELYSFMEEHWNTEEYNPFERGRPNPLSAEEYIMLPATPRFLVLVYSRAAGGLFSKDNKVILTTANTPEGVSESLIRGIPTSNIIFGGIQISSSMSAEKERKGPAEDILQMYTEYMQKLLAEAGYRK